MASIYMGPEMPKPFSVISESDSNRYDLPVFPHEELFSFGEAYLEKLKELVHRYLELGTDETLCYVGHEKGSLVSFIEKEFCLLKPVTVVSPGEIHYEETPWNKMVPIRVAHVGAEEFFKDEAQKNPQFDRVLLKDALDFFEQPLQTYTNIMKTINSFGRLLIIQRPVQMNTLPLFSEAKGHIAKMDQSYMSIIQDLQGLNLDIQWEIESLPIVMEKYKWMAMLKEKYPLHMEGLSNMDIRLGIRELNEGILKYEGPMIEFTDHLLFISASHKVVNTYPSIQRFGATNSNPFPGMNSLRYKMEMTDDIENMIKTKKQEDKAKSRPIIERKFYP